MTTLSPAVKTPSSPSVDEDFFATLTSTEVEVISGTGNAQKVLPAEDPWESIRFSRSWSED